MMDKELEKFKLKWVDRRLYELGGYIRMYDRKIKLYEASSSIFDCYVLELPTWQGWGGDEQKKEFMQDAKSIGFSPLRGKKYEWYKPK